MLDRKKAGCVLGVALVAACSQRALAQQQTQPIALTEAEVVRLAVAAEPRLRLSRAEVGMAQAAVRTAGLLDNPSLSWDREAIPGSNGESEDAVALAVPVDLSGRRAARTALAQASLALAKAGERRTRTSVAARALRAFYATLAAREEVDIAQRSLERLDEAVRVVVRRHEEGSVSGYDRLRLEIEAELVRSHDGEARANVQQRGALLSALVGVEPERLTLAGSLAPSDAIVAGDAEGQAARRPSRQRLAEAVTALDAAVDAAGRGYIPRLELHGGVRAVSADDTRLGYVAGVSAELPIFSHGQDLEQDAAARRGAVSEQMAADLWTSRVAIVEAGHRLASARAELSRLEAAMGKRLERLERSALARYREGSGGVTELLEAQRTRTAVERRLLQLRLSAKQAEVALRAARGELE